MAPIRENGFLGNEICGWAQECRTQHREWFELCAEINRFAHRLLFNLEVHSESPRETISALIFTRALDNFQGSVVLAERGMLPQAQILCRCALEAAFSLHAIAKDDDTISQLIQGDRRHQLRLLKNARELLQNPQSVLRQQTTEQELAARISELEESLRTDRGEPPKIKDLANKGGLLELYYSAYAILSLTVHSNLRDLEKQLGLDDRGHISTLYWGPDPRTVDEVLFTASEAIMLSCDAVAEIFDVPIEQISQLKQKRRELAETLLGSVETGKLT